MSTLKVNTLQTAAGVEVYTAKAWVNFNGTGTVAIRASGNVTSITDNGTGDYTVNFTNAMPDANYVPTGMINSTGGGIGLILSRTQATSSVNIETRSGASTPSTNDFSGVFVAIHR